MVSQSDFPEIWSTECDSKDVRVEVRVRNGDTVVEDAETSIETEQGEEISVGPDTTVTTPGENATIIISNVGVVSDLRFEVFDDEGESHLSWIYPESDGVYFEDGSYKIDIEADRLPRNPNVVVTNATQFAWIEIPTTKVELWQTKGQAAQIQRTAKVEFPSEWGGESPRELIDSFGASEEQPFMFARIFMRENPEATWTIDHLGWIGGVGPMSQSNMSKMWIYDFAELLSGTPVGETFHQPSVEHVAESIANTITGNSATPLSGVRIIGPETEEEFSRLASEVLSEGDFAATDATISSNTQYYSLSGVDTEFRVRNGDEVVGENIEGLTTPGDDVNFESITIDTREEKFIPFEPDAKHFTANRDTLVDLIRWFEDKTSAKVHFEPHPNGRSVLLVVDVIPSRRTFAQDAVIDREDDIDFHESITVLENDALYEMKPLNTLHLRGSYPQGIVDTVWDGVSGALSILPGNDGPPSEKYPVVKVQVPALVQAAEGVELSGEPVESDAKTLDSAESEARTELSRRLEEQSEGHIVTEGKPHMLPFDRIISFETCDEFVEYEQTPVQYEIEEVKHTVSADGTYQSEALISIWANDTNIETVRKEMVEVKN